MHSDQEIDKIFTSVVVGNTAQGVLHKLEQLQRHRDRVLTRWVWELLQNARDAAVDTDASLVASIVMSDGEVVFRHNGTNFKVDEIGHLIYHGSTKLEDPETLGRYGSGFLATHLLSPEIEIAGQLDDGRPFRFKLTREASSVRDLTESMERAHRDFKASLGSTTELNGFTTQFRYRIMDSAVDAVEEGIEAVKRCAPFILAFNREFARIEIDSAKGTMKFQTSSRTTYERDGLQQITVLETDHRESIERHVLLAQHGRTAVACPVSTGNTPECLPVGQIPKLFLGFPLIGTEDFSFPGIINSFDFTPTENRDGVYLAVSRNNEANARNEKAVETACELLIALFRWSASSGWLNTYNLAHVPDIPGKDWLNPGWLQTTIKDVFIEGLRQNLCILDDAGDTVSHIELPIAETDEGVKSLYDLLAGWSDRPRSMPRQSEVIGWANAVKSWSRISECEVSSFEEVMDGQKLADQIQDISLDKSAPNPIYRLSLLQAVLAPSISAIEWLNQFHSFLMDNGLGEVIREYRVVPGQTGFLRNLPNLYRDEGIDEELKHIADLMEWRLRRDLRDARLTAVAADPGKGQWNNEYVVGELIKKLREQCTESPEPALADASAQIFAWICNRGEWNRLVGFPVFAAATDSENLRVINLDHGPDAELRLAPVPTWNEDLRPFEDLFPRRHIISSAFYRVVPSEQVWASLEEKGFCSRGVMTRRNITIRKEVYGDKEANLDPLLPNEPLADGVHETLELVDVTDIAFLTREDVGIMARVRSSARLARLFWEFLSEWMTTQDPRGLDPHEAACTCGRSHRYYPAHWLGPVRANMWVPLGSDKRGPATAQNLADLLRGSGWGPESLNGNPVGERLLEAIGITRLDLVRAFVASTEEERKQHDSLLIGILSAAAGQPTRLNQARQFLEQLQEDKDLPQVLEDRRRQRQIVHENQTLGKQVEDLVRKTLEEEGFTVRRKPIGSDFEIEYDTLEGDEELGIEVLGPGQTWLVEVKATRGQAVRMTQKQANTAKEKGPRFLLCVVPIESDESILELSVVGSNMRFVQGIGPLVAPLCNDLDDLRDLRETITADDASPIQLIVESGIARVQVRSTVWERDGFELGALLGRLSTDA